MMAGTGTIPRSCLCVPGDDARKMVRALGSAADEFVVDFEDAVSPDRKEVARTTARDVLQASDFDNVVVRINGLTTSWWREDLATIAAIPAVTGIVIPKAEDVDQLLELGRELDDLERESGHRPFELQLLIESARGLLHLDSLLAGNDRVVSVILGYADLAVSLQRPVGPPGATTWLAVQDRILLHARAHGVRAVDGPWFDFRDTTACAAANAHAAAYGFDSKWVIHPGQVADVNAAFSPADATVQWARRVIAAFDSHGSGGVLAVDGTMVDKPVVDAARQVLAKKRALALEDR